jgi:HSP20 family molecular chaperone IbpA
MANDSGKKYDGGTYLDPHAPQSNDYDNWEPEEPPTPGRPVDPQEQERRSDFSILEDVVQILARHAEIDASDINIIVDQGEVVLTGTVPEQQMKYLAQDVTEQIAGVRKIVNQLRKASTPERSL